MIDFVVHWHKQTGIFIGQFLSLLGLSTSTYYDWKARYGAPNGTYGSLPKTSWLQDWEKQAIITYAIAHPEQGYRRLAYQMIDEDVVAVSPSSVYRVLKGADLLSRTLKKEIIFNSAGKQFTTFTNEIQNPYVLAICKKSQNHHYRSFALQK